MLKCGMVGKYMGKLNGEKSYFSQVYVDSSHCRSGPRSLASSLGIESHSLKKQKKSRLLLLVKGWGTHSQRGNRCTAFRPKGGGQRAPAARGAYLRLSYSELFHAQVSDDIVLQGVAC